MKYRLFFLDLSKTLESTESEKRDNHPRFQQKINDILSTPYQEKDALILQTRIRNQNSNLITALLISECPSHQQSR